MRKTMMAGQCADDEPAISTGMLVVRAAGSAASPVVMVRRRGSCRNSRPGLQIVPGLDELQHGYGGDRWPGEGQRDPQEGLH
jgi:hypothetical protein